LRQPPGCRIFFVLAANHRVDIAAVFDNHIKLADITVIPPAEAGSPPTTTAVGRQQGIDRMRQHEA